MLIYTFNKRETRLKLKGVGVSATTAQQGEWRRSHRRLVVSVWVVALPWCVLGAIWLSSTNAARIARESHRQQSWTTRLLRTLWKANAVSATRACWTQMLTTVASQGRKGCGTHGASRGGSLVKMSPGQLAKGVVASPKLPTMPRAPGSKANQAITGAEDALWCAMVILIKFGRPCKSFALTTTREESMRWSYAENLGVPSSALGMCFQKFRSALATLDIDWIYQPMIWKWTQFTTTPSTQSLYSYSVYTYGHVYAPRSAWNALDIVSCLHCFCNDAIDLTHLRHGVLFTRFVKQFDRTQTL